MSGADGTQVGGTHYQSTYQHWNLVLNCGLGYLDGNATKYLARHKKSGKMAPDLQKAKHYVEKLLEDAQKVSVVGRKPRHWVQQEVGRFCRANDITGRERHLFFLLCNWQVEADLIRARDIIAEFIASAEQLQFLSLAERIGRVGVHDLKSVPLEDSNKHADRATGANDLKEGDRVIHELDKRHGVAGEFLQDGDCFVFFDDGKHDMVKWANLVSESGW